jgi:hypothetical protein
VIIAGLASLLCWAILGVAGVCATGARGSYFEPGGRRENRSEIAAAILRAIGR